MLERYADDERVMHISGSNFQFGQRRTKYSYYFSRYNHGVGWASWRHAWQHYDAAMKLWPEVKEQGLLAGIFSDKRAVQDWMRAFQLVYEQKIDSWAYCWTFACWVQNGLSILPNVNLLSNIGFGADSTHTKNSRSRFARMQIEAMDFPLTHPPFVMREMEADAYTQKRNYGRSLLARAGSRLLHRVMGS